MNSIYINTLLFIALALTHASFAQESSNISDCSGAIELQINKSLQPRFTKRPGEINDLAAYSKKLQELETNSLWLKFSTNNSGILRLAIKKSNFPLEYSLFILKPDEGCPAIIDASTNLVRHEVVDKDGGIFRIDSIAYQKNQIVYICLNTTPNIKEGIEIQNQFIVGDTQKENQEIKPKLYDFRPISTDKPYHIMIRDMETGQPIIAKVIISGSKTNNALYKASDFIFTNVNNLKMELKISAKGYFFKDVSINNRGEESKEKIIQLKRLKKDQLIELESIKFEPQTDIFLPEAVPKLRRLRDFMVINPDVEIEIQGHVNLLGDNTIGAKSLSKKRAKRVRKFLADNGIDENRISVYGFGNSKMIYPKAETEDERQANRRVEIRIK